MNSFSLRSGLLSVALLTVIFSPAHAQTFAFELPWDDDAQTPTSLADLNPAPLNEAHRIKIKDGHFVDQTGRRVRFLGTNIGSSANFTKPEEAGTVAARLHKYGFNIVRLHHMDAAWSNPSIFGADHDAGQGPNQKVDPDSLALLDNMVGEFKKQGIYVDLNLHVSRTLSPGDGFPDTDKLPELGKVLAYFEPQFIAQQKEYARQILDHVNAKTGKKWADDPTVALVELNNEDSLVGNAWNGTLQGLPTYYRDTLKNGWNTFLGARYANDAALRRAWEGQPIDDNILRDPARQQGTEGWTQVEQDVAKATLTSEPMDEAQGGGVALKVEIQQKPAADWQLELVQGGVSLTEGQYYTASFRARAAAPRPLGASVGLAQAPWTRAGSANFNLTTDWKTYRFVFRASGMKPTGNRLIFALGGASDTVTIADVQLRPGVVADIAPEWSLTQSNFDLPGTSVVPKQAQDWIDYLAAIEKSYVDTMTDFIKNEIGYKGLVTCSQASYGNWAGVARESRTDWIDTHAYWQHPNFPNQPWDANDWNIPNTAMTDEPGTGTLLGLASHRVSGKPFTVSEYNHPAPNDYASETVPMILGYAAAQDWDGVFLFSYNGSRDNWNPGRIRGYFDMDSDPNKMALLPGMARAFLRGDIAAFKGSTTLTVPRDQLLPLTAQAVGAGVYSGVVADEWRKRGLTRADLLESRVQLNIAPTGTEPKLERNGPRGGAWQWDWRGPRGVVSIDAPNAKAFAGRVGDEFVVGPLQAGAARFSDVQSSNQWATLSLVSLDKAPINQSKSLLLTALNRAENKDMGWNAERTTVGNKWGEGPTQIEVPRANISIQTKAKSARVFRLTPTGARGPIQSSTLKDGVLSFEIGPQDETVWWQIVTE